MPEIYNAKTIPAPAPASTIPAKPAPIRPAPPANVDALATAPLAVGALPASVVAEAAVVNVLPPTTTTVDVPGMA